MTLVDAVRKRCLVHWNDHGAIRTIEPQLLAHLRGNRVVVIAFQIEGGSCSESGGCWKLIDVNERLNPIEGRSFKRSRPLPEHFRDLVQLIYVSPNASPLSFEDRK